MDNEDRIKRKEKKKAIANELFETEKKYLEDLNTLSEVYIKALSDHPKTGSWGLETLLRDMSISLQMIIETNTKLLEELKQEYESEIPKIGKVFLNFKEDLKCYVKYCSNHEFYRLAIGEAKNKNKTCMELLNVIRMNDNRVKLNDLEGFLIKPIQRICKYPLFFEQLEKCMDEEDEDMADVQTGLSNLQKITEMINEGTKMLQTQEKIKELNPELKRALGKDFELFQEDRYFMREAVLPKAIISRPNTSIKKMMNVHLVLFSDLLLIGISSAKSNMPSFGKFRYKTHFMLGLIKIIEERNITDPNFILEETVQDKTRSMTIFFGNHSTRLLWFREISELSSKIKSKTFKMSKKVIIEDLKEELEKKRLLLDDLALMEEKSRKNCENLQSSLEISKNELQQSISELEKTKDILLQTQTLSNQLNDQHKQAQLKSQKQEKEIVEMKDKHKLLQQQTSSNLLLIKTLKLQITSLESQIEEESLQYTQTKKNLENNIENLEKKLQTEKQNMSKTLEQRDSMKESLQNVNKEYNQVKMEIEMIKKNNVSTKEMFGKETQYLMEQVQTEQRKYLDISRSFQEEVDSKKHVENLLEEQKNLNFSLNENISVLKIELSNLDNSFQSEIKKTKELNSKISQSFETIESLESKISDLEFAKESLSRNLVDVTDTYDKSQIEIASLNQKILISEKTIVMLEEEKNFLEISCQNLKHQIEKLNETNSGLNNKIDSLNQTIHSDKQKFSSKLKSLQNEINDLSNNLKTLNNLLLNEKSKSSDFENQIQEKNLLIINESNRIKSLNTQIDLNHIKIQSLSDKIQDLEGGLEKKNSDNESLLKVIDDLKKQSSILKENNLVVPKNKAVLFSFFSSNGSRILITLLISLILC